MADPFFGELYLRSTRPLLSESVTAEEVAYLGRALTRLGVPKARPVLDLGAGHGRHAAPLAARGWRVIGVEKDARSLRRPERLPGFRAVRADFYRLPFADRSIAGAYAWYSSLFTLEDAQHVRLLAELARALAPGAGLIFQSVSFERLAAAPEASFECTLPDGSLLQETSRFDPVTGRDQGRRTLTFPDGRRLSAQYFIRYYRQQELEKLLTQSGFRVRWVEGGLSGQPLDIRSTDFILGAERDG